MSSAASASSTLLSRIEKAKDKKRKRQKQKYSTAECSAEVKNLIQLLTSFNYLCKGVYCTRGRREGLMGSSAAEKLKAAHKEKEKRVAWSKDRLETVKEAFVKVLQEDDRETPLLHHRQLDNRVYLLASRYDRCESLRDILVETMARKGLLGDDVALLNSSLQETHVFFSSELKSLRPKIQEAGAISKLVDETVKTVRESTEQLTKLFKQKGKELASLQKKKSSNDDIAAQMEMEKKHWEGKMTALEKKMQRGTRMAKIGAQACFTTRAENEVLIKDIEKSLKMIKEQEAGIDKEQRAVEALYDKLDDLNQFLAEAGKNGAESENFNMRLNQQILMKKREHDELMTRLENNGYNSYNLQAVEKDIKRMGKKMKEEQKKEMEMEEELAGIEQRIFELELQETERNIMLGINPDGDASSGSGSGSGSEDDYEKGDAGDSESDSDSDSGSEDEDESVNVLDFSDDDAEQNNWSNDDTL